MLFDKLKCKNCGQEYDSMLDECPSCQETNKEVKPSLKGHVTWLPPLTELAVFLIGSLGLILFGLISNIIFRFLKDYDITYAMLVNYSTYVFALLALMFALLPFIKNIANSFKKLWVIPVGIGLGIGLIFISMGYNIIIRLIFKSTTSNDNQQSIEIIYNNYLFPSLILFGLIGPLCEEITYRLGLFTLLKRINKILPYIIAPIVFGLIHFNVSSTNIVNELINLPNYIIAGLYLCFVYNQFGFTASYIAHATNNIIPILLAAIARQIQ